MKALQKITIALLLILSFQAKAQKLKKLLEDGNNAIEKSDYYLAEAYFKKAYSIDSTDIVIQYQLANASLLNANYLLAERYFEKVYKRDTEIKYPDALYNYAVCKRYNSKYKEAAKLFDKYAKRNVKKNPEKAALAKKNKDDCNFALLLISNPIPLVINHLDTNINSKTAEFSPFEADSVLYFTQVNSDIKKNEGKIMFSKIKGDKYLPMQLFDTVINQSNKYVANLVMNKTLDELYCSICDQKNGASYTCAIYVSKKINNKWKTPTILSKNINVAGYTSTQPIIATIDGNETMFFSSNRPNGEGGMDIWKSTKTNGEWQAASNLGAIINSKEDEITPFFCNPCLALFFSSTFHQGMGGFDIFKSHLNKNEFTKPENLGYPINSAHNDMYYKTNLNRSKAYFTSNREGSLYEKYETCCNDIYMINTPESTDTLENELAKSDTVTINMRKLRTLVPMTLYFNNDEPDNKTLNTTTTKTYSETYNSYYSEKKKYLTAYAKGLNDMDKEIAINQMEDFFEDSVQSGLKDLEQFAKLLLSVLKEGEKVGITIKGYCSPLASNAYNTNLAKRRISSVINYLNTFNDGVLKDMIKNQVDLKIEEIGELKASSIVSDNPNDATNSVYSRAAALERKISILAVTLK